MDSFIIFYVFLGILIGTVTGITPGLHPNTASALFLTFSFLDPLCASVALVSASVTHTFLDFIPSIVFGAPEPETALSILPGHEMTMRGRAYRAIKLTVVGGVSSLLIGLLFFPLLALFIGNFYELLKVNMVWILIAFSLYMFLKDRKPWSIVVFFLSGLLGFIVLSKNLLGYQGLLPMLTGLFGLSTLIFSIKNKVQIPAQQFDCGEVKGVLKSGIIGAVSGILVGLLPGVGSAQATFITREVLKEKDEERFMIAIGGVNTTVAVFSLLALWLVGRARSGVAAAVGEMLGKLSLTHVLLFLGVIMLSGGVSAVLTLLISKRILNLLRKIEYRKLNLLVIIFLTSIVFWFTGVVGVLTLFVSTTIGLACILSGTRRSYMMACIVVPTILNLI